MHRHDLDAVALVFGATFAVLGLAYVIARWTWIDVDRGWVLGVFLIALGIAGVVSVTSRQRAGSRTGLEQPARTGPVPPDR